jgi:hypothetical protein
MSETMEMISKLLVQIAKTSERPLVIPLKPNDWVKVQREKKNDYGESHIPPSP